MLNKGRIQSGQKQNMPLACEFVAARTGFDAILENAKSHLLAHVRSLASSAANAVRLLDASPFVKLRVLSYEPTAVRSRYLYQKSGASVLTAFLQNTRK